MAGQNDYDGKWNVDISCSIHLINQRPGFSYSEKWDIKGNRINHVHKTTTKFGAEQTVWDGQISNQNISLKAVATRDNGDTWSWIGQGKVSSPESFQMITIMNDKSGTKIRDCVLKFTSLDPAVGSLANSKNNTQTTSVNSSQPKNTIAAEIPKTPVNKLLEETLQKANAGDPASMNLLGNLYYTGSSGVDKNLVEAKKWFEASARKNFPSGNFNMGVLYEKGEAVPKDESKAIQYYKIAASGGSQAAQKKLDGFGINTSSAIATTAPTDNSKQLATKTNASPALQNLSSLNPGQIRIRIINQSVPADIIENISFNFGFISRFREKLSSAPQGSMAYLDIAHYNFFLSYKNKINEDYLAIDDFFNNIATQLGVNKKLVYSSFGINLNPSGSVNESGSAKSAIDGMLTADQYWMRYPLTSPYPRSVNEWYDSKSPAQLFNEFYPSIILGFNSFIPKIYSTATSVSTQLAKSQKEYDDRQKWLQSPEGQKFTANEQAKVKQAQADEDARINKEFPFYAVLTCSVGNSGGNAIIQACFSGKYSNTQIELTNGSEYGLYQNYEFNRIGKDTNQGFVINLRENFAISVQNSSDSLILGLKIFNRKTKQQTFIKQVPQFGVIKVRN